MARVRAARAVTAAEVDTTEDGRMLGLWLGAGTAAGRGVRRDPARWDDPL